MDKKTTIFGFIAIVILAGIVWYAAAGQDSTNQTASLAEKTGEKASEKETEQTPKYVEDFVFGDPDAPVVLLEYSNHFCGHCVSFHKDTLPLIMENYVKTGKVKLVEMFLSGMSIGQTLLCVKEQNPDVLLEFNEYLFENLTDIAEDDLPGLVEEFGMDGDKFEQCRQSDKYVEKVQDWHVMFQGSGLTGTPTFFVNNRKLIGSQPYNVFKDAIDEALIR